MNRAGGRWSASGCRAAAVALAGAVVLTACDLGVTNPATIEDTDLDRVEAIPAIVNGVRGDFGTGTVNFGLGGAYGAGALLTDEMVHVGSWQPPRQISDGNPGWTEPENQSHWGYAQRGRWVAEDAIRRIGNLVANPQADPNIAMVTLYAGFANRVLGDNFCHAVINGGPLEEYTRFHERAVQFFTDAIAVAQAANQPNLVTAAYGGRAQSYMMLGNWQAAVADAQRVPTNYVFNQPHSDNAPRERNDLFFLTRDPAGGEQYSVWGTPFAQWGTEINNRRETERDPRVRYQVVVRNNQEVSFLQFGVRRPLYYSEKYANRSAPIPIVKGTEMRLIEAEAALVGGNVGGAVTAMNAVRTHRGLSAVSAANADAAWELLMKERGLELWLEGRRLADLRRWQQTPGWVRTQVVRYGGPRNVLDTEQPLCLKVSSNEINSNPNIQVSPYN